MMICVKRMVIMLILIMIVVLLIVSISLNIYIVLSTKSNIQSIDKLVDKDIDCIIILGAGIWGERPSYMLEDRLLTGINLYENRISRKIIVSGDHGRVNYDEVNVMKDYLIEKGIPSENIFMDHAGFSTYDSIYRAKEIFKADRVIIVTQKYHLYRALYIAWKLDIDASGVVADKREYFNQFKMDIREFVARIKDYFKCIFKPEATYLGEVIPVSGNGDITNDKILDFT